MSKMHADIVCANLLADWPLSLSAVAGRVLADMVTRTRTKAGAERLAAERLSAAGAVVRVRVPPPTCKAVRCTADELRSALAELCGAGYLAPRPVGFAELYTVEAP